MHFSSNVESSAHSQSAARTSDQTDQIQPDKEERCTCRGGCDVCNLVPSDFASMPASSPEELTQNRALTSPKINEQMLDCQSNTNIWETAEDGIRSDIDKISQQKTDPKPIFLLVREENHHQSNVDSASSRSSLVLDEPRTHNEVEAISDHDAVRNQDAESDSGSDFEWKPVKRSKTRKNKVKWEARRFGIELEDDRHVDDERHSVNDLESDNKRQEDDEGGKQARNSISLLQPSSSLQAADGFTTNGAKEKHNTKQLHPRSLLLPLDQEKDFTHHRASSLAGFKKPALSRQHPGKHRLGVSEMDDATYLTAFGIEELLSKLAMALLEQKPNDHVDFTRKWIEFSMEMERKGEKKEGADRLQGRHSHYYYDKRVLGKHSGSPGTFNLMNPASALSTPSYTGGAVDAISPRGDQLTRRRLKEVLKTELDAKRSYHVNHPNIISGLTEKPRKKQNKTRSRRLSSEFRRGLSQRSESSNKCNSKRRRCFSKVKITDKVNDYLKKVELTGVSNSARDSPIPTNVALLHTTDGPSPPKLNTLVPTLEGRSAGDTHLSPQSSKSWLSSKNNSLMSGRPPLDNEITINEEGKCNDSKSVLNSTVDLNLAEIRPSSDAQSTAATLALLDSSELPNPAIVVSPIATGENHGASSFREIKQKESKEPELNNCDKVSDVNSFAVSISSNSYLLAPQTDGSLPTFSALKNETRVETSKLGSSSSCTILPSPKDFDAEVHEERKEDSGDINNALVTFAPVITFDQSTSGINGSLPISSVNKAGSFNSLLLPPTSGQTVVTSTTSTPHVPGTKNIGRETVANSRGSRLTSATADIPAKLLAAIAPTTTSNANRAAQQKLANDAVAISASGSTTNKLGGTTKAVLAVTPTSSEANLTSSRNSALNAAYNQGGATTTTTIGTARLKLHSLANGSDTMATKSKLAFLRGTGEHGNPSLKLNSSSRSMSPSASPLTLPNLQPNVFQPYNSNLSISLATNPNTTSGTMFSKLQQSSLYTPENSLDNKVDLAPFSSIEGTEKTTSSGDNLPCKRLSTTPMELDSSSGSGGVWTRCINSIIGKDDEAKSQIMPKQSSPSDIDMPSPKVSSMPKGSNAAVVMGSSSNTAFNFSSVGSLLNNLGESVGFKFLPKCLLTTSESSLMAAQREVLARINSALCHIPPKMHTKVLSFLEGLLGKTNEGDTNNLGSLPLDMSRPAGLNTFVSFQLGSPNAPSVNFSNTMRSSDTPLNTASRMSPQGCHGTESNMYPTERSKTLTKQSHKSPRMHYSRSCPTLSNTQWEKVTKASYGADLLSLGLRVDETLDTNDHSHFPEVRMNTQTRSQRNLNDFSFQKVAQNLPLGHDTATVTPRGSSQINDEQTLAPRDIVIGLKRNVRAFAASINSYSQTQVVASIPPLAQGQYSPSSRPPNADGENATIDLTHEKTPLLCSTDIKDAAHSIRLPSMLHAKARSPTTYGREEGVLSPETRGLSETDKRKCAAPCDMGSRDQPICKDYSLKATTVFDVGLTSEVPLPTLLSKGTMTDDFHTVTVMGASENEHELQKLEVNEESAPIGVIEDDFHNSSQGQLEASSRENNFEIDKSNNSVRCVEGRESTELRTDVCQEVIKQQNREVSKKGDHEVLPMDQLTHVDREQIIGDRQITVKMEHTEHEWRQNAEGFIETSIFSEGKASRPCSVRTSEGRRDHKNKKKICIPSSNFAPENLNSSKRECTLSRSSDSQLVASNNAMDFPHPGKLGNTINSSQSVPIIRLKYPEDNTRSTRDSSGFSRLLYPSVNDTKLSHRHGHNRDNSSTPKNSPHHRSHRSRRHHCKEISKDTTNYPKRGPLSSKKVRPPCFGQDQEPDSLKHDTISGRDDDTHHTATVDVRNPMTLLSQSHISGSTAFPNTTPHQTATCKKRRPRGLSLNFSGEIDTFPKSAMREECSHGRNPNRKKRSLSVVSYTLRLKHDRDDHQNRTEQQRRQCAHSKCNASSFPEHLSEEGLGGRMGGKTTPTFSFPHDKKFPDDHYTYARCASHFTPQRSSNTGRVRHQRSAHSFSGPSDLKDYQRSLVELTMDFLNRRDHLETQSYAAGNSHESFVSASSPPCVPGDALRCFPNVFSKGQVDKGMSHDPKLDYAIAMTALAVAEGKLSSPCHSTTSSAQFLSVADRIYLKKAQPRSKNEGFNRVRRPSRSFVAPNIFSKFTESTAHTDGGDAITRSSMPNKAIPEEFSSNVEEVESNVTRSAQHSGNRETQHSLTTNVDCPIDVSASTCDNISSVPLQRFSSTGTDIEKRLLEENTIYNTTSLSDSKGIILSSEELVNIHEAISQNTILASFDKNHIEMLILAMSHKVLNVNDILVREGELWVGCLIFVAKGSLSAICRENTLQRIEAGSLYGEVEFFDNTKRSPVTLVAAEAPTVTVCFLDNKDFINLVMSQKRVFKMFFMRFIEKIPLFQGCPDPIKHRLADALRPHRIEQGTTFMNQGSQAEWLYVIVSGDLTLNFVPERIRKGRDKCLTRDLKLRTSCLGPPGIFAGQYAASSRESLVQDDKGLLVHEQTDETGPLWKNPRETSHHSIDDMSSLIAKNDGHGSTGVNADCLLPYSSDSSEGAKSTNSNRRFSVLSLPTSIFVDNMKISTTMPSYRATQSDDAMDQPNTRSISQENGREGLPLPADCRKGQYSLKCSSGSLVGAVELVFGSKSLFTARAETVLRVARISPLHFDAIIPKEVLDAFKNFMVVHPMYRFLRKVAPRKVRSEMNLIGLNQTIEEGKNCQSSSKTASTLSSIRWFDGQDDKKSNAASRHRKNTGRSISKLAAVEQLPHFRKMSSFGKLSQIKDKPPSRNKPMMNTATTISHQSHIQTSENDKSGKVNTISGNTPHAHRFSNTKHSSIGSSLWHQISPDGEIVFLGGRNLYRFPLEALCANNTIIIEIIMDGTIIQWNPIAQHVIGYVPYEVIGQNIFDLMNCEESRKKLRTMLKAGKEYAGKWESYVSAELNSQKIFSFRQNTGLYQIDVALSVIPSISSSFSEVFLLVGRESKYHAAANYSTDVVAWLNERMRPQLANFQYYISYIESKKWMVTPDDAILLRRHLDACMVTVEHLARLSLLTMETVRDSLRPTQLIVPIRHFINHACALVRNTNCNLSCNADDITPNVNVFLDAEKVILFLCLLLKDVINSLQYDPEMHVDIELRVMIIEPESTYFGQQLKPDAAQPSPRQSPRSQQQNQDQADPGVNGAGSPGAVAALSGGGGNSLPGAPSNSPQSRKASAPSSVDAVKSSLVSGPRSTVGDTKESKSSAAYSSLPPQSSSSAYPPPNAEQSEGIDLQLSSLRRICFELRDNGLTIPLFHSTREAADGPESPSKSFLPTVLSPTLRFDRPEAPPTAPYNSPVVADGAAPAFPRAARRGEALPHVERLVAAMGGLLRCFTRPEVDGNVVRVELPLLPVPGSREAGPGAAAGASGAERGGRSLTVLVADTHHVHRNHLCQILWARQHAVIPLGSFDELMRAIAGNTADILIIDPIQLDLGLEDYVARHGRDPFGDILERTSRMVLIVVGMDFSDWRVRRLLDRNSVIEVPKLGSAALIHIAIQEAEQMVAEMRDEEDRIEQLRANFTNAAAGRHKVGRLLGKGTFGDVYEVKDTLTSGRMAMKRMQLHEGTVVDEVVQEILAMTSLQHENIVHYFYCEKESDTMLRLYMELATEGSLRDRIRENPGVGLPFEEIVQRLTGICRGLAYVHSQHYVHCDLKTANLLLGTHGRTKIGDFGTAKQLKPGQKLYKLLGTPQYMAPEVLMADVQQRIGYDYKADVWSVGCIALEMATGLPPFSHIEQSHGMGIIKYLSELTDTPDLSPLFSGNPLIYEFVKACLEINAELRPTAQELLHFDILQGTGTSIRAERIMRRAEMLYKLNKYASIRDKPKERSNDESNKSDSESTDGTDDYEEEEEEEEDGVGGGDGGGGDGRAAQYSYETNFRNSVSSSSASESSFTSTSSSQSALSLNWSIESLQPSISSKTM